MNQLALPFAVRPSYAEADFLVSPSNAQAHAAVTLWPRWPGSTLLLIGPAGSGKTHLAAIWAARARASFFGPERLEHGPPAIGSAGVIDGADTMGLSETALFGVLNAAAEGRSPLLLTARSAPERWGSRSPDVVSRLRRAFSVAIAAPDDGLLRAVLVKLFADRQLEVDASLLAFLTVRIERSLEAATRIVQALDEAGLARGRRITRAVAADVLEAARA